MKKRIMGFVGLLVCMASWVIAGSFDATLVPQDARWVAHMDFAAMRASTIGQHLMQQDVNEDVKQQWEQAEEMFGMDLREDLHAVTMYGSGVEQDDVVIWFRGRLNPDALTSQVAELDQYESTTYQGYTIHSWVDASAEEAVRVYGVILDETRAVIGPRAEHIQQALAVAAGDQPRVTDGGISVSTLAGAGVLVAATADFRDVDLSQNPMLAQANVSARYFRMDMRERDGTLGVRVAVQQDSEQEAQQTQEMLNGLKMSNVQIQESQLDNWKLDLDIQFSSFTPASAWPPKCPNESDRVTKSVEAWFNQLAWAVLFCTQRTRSRSR